MSFVGTRPEVVKYVEKYKPEYMATLLLPAGITSEAIHHFILWESNRFVSIANMDKKHFYVQYAGTMGCERMQEIQL